MIRYIDKVAFGALAEEFSYVDMSELLIVLGYLVTLRLFICCFFKFLLLKARISIVFEDMLFVYDFKHVNVYIQGSD